MKLWVLWFQCVWALRAACSRRQTYAWMVVALVSLCIRSDLAGVTSFVRALELRPEAYPVLLHLFHSSALDLDALTNCWVRLVLNLFTPFKVGDYIVCLADGIKAPKEGRKMPAVKNLHQESGTNSKPQFIMGHSLQAISMLVSGPTGHVTAVPLASRIHEGIVLSNRDQRTLLDKMVGLFLSLVTTWNQKVLLAADSYFASRKVILPLLAAGHQLVTRARVNAVAYYPAPQPSHRHRGRPRLYGEKVRLRDLAKEKSSFVSAPSPVYGEHDVTLRYRVLDLVWRPVGRLVRFVIVDHPVRGLIFLLASDTSLKPLEIIQVYGYRFKIEVGFRQAIHVLGAYAYHFWMMDMVPIKRGSGNQYLHRRTEDYRKRVHRKIRAYHAYVQLACIAQGILLYLSVNHSALVWDSFRSWLRTMNPLQPPSELVVAHALRSEAPEFLVGPACDPTIKKILDQYRRQPDVRASREAVA